MQKTLIAGLLLTAGLHAQGFSRRADIRGGGRDGKCTIEVEVDDVAEVEVRGDQGYIRTLSGQPSTWRRFECNQVMPPRPANFRFRGVDGRGRQMLVRDPQGGGPVVVRIEDRKGGREGYTFDLEWSGSSAGGWGSGWGNGGPAGGGWGAGGNIPQEAMDNCANAVRDRARRDYNVRDLDFQNIQPDRGRADWVVGSFVSRGGYNRRSYDFACQLDFRNRAIRSVNVVPR